MTEQKGITSLKAEIDLVTTLVNIVIQAKKDGKIDAADLALLMQLVPVIGPAATGFGEVVPELKDLSETEGAELIAYVAGKIGGLSIKAQAIVEKSLKAAIALYELEKAITMQEPAPVA